MTNIEQDRLAKRAKARSHIYGLLSWVYREEPGKEFLVRFRDSTFLQSLKELGIELGAYFKAKPLNEVSEELAVEYTRLFIGPGKHIYPYESAYRSEAGDMSSDAALQTKRLIESYGLQYRSNFCERFDHISVGLEFMEKITRMEAKAWGRNEDEAVGFLNLERQFLDRHLSRWVPEFSEMVIKQALLSFYQEMAKLTKEYILLEDREIKDLIKQIDGR